jgi:lipoyl-dependent peroxiredoxin subunit C
MMSLRHLALPMLSDLKRKLCGQLGILDESESVAQRATFIGDPRRVIRFVYATELNVSRDPGEVLRVLAELQNHFGF